MSRDPLPQGAATPLPPSLRQQAEDVSKERSALTQEAIEGLAPGALRAMLHDLRVHLIQIEMQNDDLRRMHAALEASRAWYFDLYDQAPVGYITVSEEGLILQVNLTAAALLGVARADLMDLPIFHVILKEDLDIYYHLRKKLLESGDPQSCELRLARHDGTACWVRMDASAHHDERGTIVTRIALSDITVRRQAREALREAEKIASEKTALLRSILESPHGIVIFSLDCSYRYTEFTSAHRETMKKIWGVDIEPGMNMLDAISNPVDREKAKRHFDCALRGESLYLEEEYGDLAFTRSFYENRYSPIRDVGGTILGLTVFVIDITERKQAEADLQRKNAEIERFTYTVSHDLKSPLVTIKTFLGFLEKDTEAQRADAASKDLRYIHNAADKMALMLEDLLKLARIGHKASSLVEVPLQEIVKDALSLVAGQMAVRGVESVSVTHEPVWLYGDRDRLVEVFQNLLDNAVKFLGDQPSPCVEVGVDLSGAELEIFVRDNGIGIDPRYLDKVFGLFERFDSDAPGSGLGLAMVRRIIEMHGGTIRASSEGLGHGATFRFTLPKTRATSGRPPIAKAATQVPPAPAIAGAQASE